MSLKDGAEAAVSDIWRKTRAVTADTGSVNLLQACHAFEYPRHVAIIQAYAPDVADPGQGLEQEFTINAGCADKATHIGPRSGRQVQGCAFAFLIGVPVAGGLIVQ